MPGVHLLRQNAKMSLTGKKMGSKSWILTILGHFSHFRVIFGILTGRRGHFYVPMGWILSVIHPAGCCDGPCGSNSKSLAGSGRGQNTLSETTVHQHSGFKPWVIGCFDGNSYIFLFYWCKSSPKVSVERLLPKFNKNITVDEFFTKIYPLKFTYLSYMYG